MGDAKLWEAAEGSLRDALDEFAGKGQWRINPGDGAFYGPKIDIKVRPAIRLSMPIVRVAVEKAICVEGESHYWTTARVRQINTCTYRSTVGNIRITISRGNTFGGYERL